eukprot:SAG11_NODE_8759_length_979_cov_1.227273_1_plen_87_part_00
MAALEGRLLDLERLLQSGVEPNAKGVAGSTALMDAAQGGSVECITELLDSGADVHSVDPIKWSALHYAACKRASDSSDIFLKSHLS